MAGISVSQQSVFTFLNQIQMEMGFLAFIDVSLFEQL